MAQDGPLQQVLTQEVDTSKEVAFAQKGVQEGGDFVRHAQEGVREGGDFVRCAGEVFSCMQASTDAQGEVSAVEMTPLPQAPLDRYPLVTPNIFMAWGGEGEQESESCVSPFSKNFIEVDQFRTCKLLMVHPACELLTVHPASNSLQVVPQVSTYTQADLILNMLLNIDHDSHKVIIIKLVSHSYICRSIKEVLSSVPIVSQATSNKTPVNWEDCTPWYAVDHRAFWIHTHGKNKGLPCDPDPNVCTIGEWVATSRAKTKMMECLRSVGTLEQQRLILLRGQSIHQKYLVIYWNK